MPTITVTQADIERITQGLGASDLALLTELANLDQRPWANVERWNELRDWVYKLGDSPRYQAWRAIREAYGW